MTFMLREAGMTSLLASDTARCLSATIRAGTADGSATIHAIAI